MSILTQTDAQKAEFRAAMDASGVVDPVARALASGGALVGTTVECRTANFDATIKRIVTTGWTSPGDGGSAAYDRTTATLAAAGQNVWWFNAADGSRWQIAAGTVHFAPQFGLLGGDPRVAGSGGVDARPILNAALAAPMVSVLNIGQLEHFVSVPGNTDDGIIYVPSGKGLRGNSRSTSRITIMAVPLNSRNRPVQAIYFVDDQYGFVEDLTLDCARSGINGPDRDRISGVTIRAKLGDSRGTRVSRVTVKNARGYAFYLSADYNTTVQRKIRDQLTEDCLAINSGVPFEQTGNTQAIILNPIVDAVQTPDGAGGFVSSDGGAVIPCEAMYHQYGPISDIRIFDAKGFGKAGAGILTAAVDPYALNTVIYYNPDIVNDNTTAAAIVFGSVFNSIEYRVKNFQIIGGRLESTQATGVSLTRTDGVIRGTEMLGGTGAANGLGDGAGFSATTGSIVDLYGVKIFGNSNPSGTGAAFGLIAQGDAVIRWFGGGEAKAVGPTGLAIAVGGTVEIVNPIVRIPAAAGGSATVLDKADYPVSYLLARKNATPTVEQYVPVTEVITKDSAGLVYMGQALATGVTLASPGKVTIGGSGRALLLTSTNGNNYIEQGGLGSGTVYVRGFEGNFQVGNAFAGNFYLATGATSRWTVTSAGHFNPFVDNGYDIGSAALRARVLYAGTGTINTSDEREKTWRGAMTATERKAAKAIVAELGFYQWNDAVAEKGDDARLHFGARAQRVWQIMADHGLVDPLDANGLPGKTPYAFLCFDEWEAEYEDETREVEGEPDDEGNPTITYEPTGGRITVLEAGNRFGLREGQLTLFLVAALLS